MFPVRAVHCCTRPCSSAALRASILVMMLLFTLSNTKPASAEPEAPAGQVTATGAAQISVLQMEKESRTPAQQKMSSRLVMMLRRAQDDPIFRALPEFQTMTPDADGFVLVDIDLSSAASLKPVLQTLRLMNAEILYQSAQFRAVRARMPLAQTEALAGMREVAGVRDADQAVTNQADGVIGGNAAAKVNVSEGDVTHEAVRARQVYGVTGARQKICALSDGVDSLAAAQATGDLPPDVDVLPGQEGFGDEGTAMLEIVHDLAPGAALGFATAFNGEAGFAQNILDLQAAGCTIIVDDVSYFRESPFQDNLIAQSAISVTTAGVLFFSSAANDGNLTSAHSGTWEGDFKANGSIGALPAGEVHDFGNGGQSNRLTRASSRVLMHWTDPFDASGNDYDLYVMNGALTSVLGASTDIQAGDGVPWEFIYGYFPAGSRVVVLRNNGAANRMINVLAFRSGLQIATSGATRGHSAAPLAYSVAAVPAHYAFSGGGPAGPYPDPFTTADQVELFSSDGPRRIFFGFDGKLLPGAPAGNYSAAGGVVRQKPDIAAADGVQTAAPGFDPFFGTSAAAPHAAAIAGLLMEAFPISSTVEIRELLQDAALDIMGPGVDRDSGYGIVMPMAALGRGGAQARAWLTNAGRSPQQVYGNDDASLDPNETWQLTIPITNVGLIEASQITAAIASSTPGVVILSAISGYPPIAPGSQQANDMPFVFRLLPDTECGAGLSFTLTVTYLGPQPQTGVLEYQVPTGQLSSAASSFSFRGPAVPIPDFTLPYIGATVPLTVSDVGGKIGQVTFSIDGVKCSTKRGATAVGIDHTYVSDLVFDLQAPDGTEVTMISNAGGDGVNFCQTVLDDAGSTSIQLVPASTAPFTGTYRPNLPLAQFVSHEANGVWTLKVEDQAGGDSGNIRAFSLHVWPRVCLAYKPGELFLPSIWGPEPLNVVR